MDGFALHLGSFSNDHGDGNDNDKKSDRIRQAKQQLCTSITLFCTKISLPSIHDYDVKVPHFTFCGGLEDKTTTFFFFS